jgi:hypothetical protein
MAYEHDNKNPNLNNLHHAMELVDEIPHVRVTLGSDNITVTGSVNIASEIKINNTELQSIPVHLTSDIDVGNFPAFPTSIDVGNFPAFPTSIDVGNFPAFPTLIKVSKDSNDNTVNNRIYVDANVSNTNPIAVTGTFWQTTQPVSGTVTANVTFPTTQQVSGTVTLDSGSLSALENINAIVSGTVELGSTTLTALENVGVTGTVTVQDGGGSITVDGTVSATVSGTVELGASTLSALENTTVTISGTPTVNIGTIPEVEIKNDSGNPVPISGNVNATITGTPVVSFGGANLDAFGRLRVSNPFTLFDGAQRYRDDPFKWNQVDTGAATSVFLPNESSVLMSVLGNGDESLRQTKLVFAYQPGKSLLTLATFVMTTPTAGLRQRVGLFGAHNGVYFEVDGNTLNLVIRKYTSGSVDDTTEKFAQTNWNGDKLNGTGPSGITLVVSRAQIFWCDIEWLGVGTVRAGFVINGQFIVCHTFHHANQIGVNKVYMTTATLPVRYELTSTGAAGTMRAICSTVISEGGYMNRSVSRSIGTSLTGKDLSNTVYRPLVCIRLKAANLESVVVPVKFDLFGLQQAAFVYRIIINPTLTAASWTSAGTDSSVEYDLSATGLSGGTVIDQGIFVGSNKGGSASITSNDVDFSQQLGRTIAGVSDIWCLAAIATTNNDDAVGVVTWQEHI